MLNQISVRIKVPQINRTTSFGLSKASSTSATQNRKPKEHQRKPSYARFPKIPTGLNLIDLIEILPQSVLGIGPNA
jgi:hypothetical protein